MYNKTFQASGRSMDSSISSISEWFSNRVWSWPDLDAPDRHGLYRFTIANKTPLLLSWLEDIGSFGRLISKLDNPSPMLPDKSISQDFEKGWEEPCYTSRLSDPTRVFLIFLVTNWSVAHSEYLRILCVLHAFPLHLTHITSYHNIERYR